MRRFLEIPVVIGMWLIAGVPAVLAIVWLVSGEYQRGLLALAVFAALVFVFVRIAKAVDRWAKREKLNANRIFIQRYICLPVFIFVVLGLIYPGVLLVAKWTGIANPGDPIAYCTAFSHEKVGILLGCEMAAWLSLAVLFKMRNSAVLALLEAVPFGLLIGTWFAAGAAGVLLCQDLPGRETLYPLLHACLIPLTIYSITWLHRRLRTVIEFNPHVYDFRKMQFALFATVARPDGATVKPQHYVIVVAFFIAAALALNYLLSFEVPKQFVSDWEFVILLTALSYVFLVAAASGISTAWLVARKCHGRKMTIKEFSISPGHTH